MHTTAQVTPRDTVGICPLKFHNAALDEIERLAYLHDEMGNSRAGFAAYYRYDPRRVRALCNDDYNKVWIARPKIHHSTLDRIKGKHIDYAPHVIPAAYDVVDASGAVAANPYETPTQARQREEDLERAWDLPCGETPVSTVTMPVGSTRMEQLSHPPMPGGRRNDGPIPLIAT